MANQIKVIDRNLPAQERYVSFTSAELADNDVIRVVDCLGRAADTMTITIVGDGLALKVRINSRVIVYPLRTQPEKEPFGWVENGYKNVALPVEYQTGVPQIDVAARGAGTYSFTDIPIRDVEIDTGAGTGSFTIILS